MYTSTHYKDSQTTVCGGGDQQNTGLAIIRVNNIVADCKSRKSVNMRVCGVGAQRGHVGGRERQGDSCLAAVP
jgi:hypothetical protein